MEEKAKPITPVDVALADAERRGFLFAVYGRALAIGVVALFSLWGYYFPTNIVVSLATFFVALLGLVPLIFSGRRPERIARLALFAFDPLLISALLAFAPLSSGGDVPQNLVFLTSRVQNYYLVIAAAVLTLSPLVVLWTGFWSLAGLGLATLSITQGVGDYLTFNDLPPGPSRDVFIAVVLNPKFIGLSSRFQEMLMIGAVTGITAFAVHRAKLVVRAHASAEARTRHVRSLFGQYVPAPVVEALLDEGHLAPQLREATVVFVDIEGFTRITESMPPTKLIPLLNEIFTTITDLVGQEGGIVIGYIGDAVVATFNAPVSLADHAARAIHATKSLLQSVNGKQFRGETIHLRIGVATGPVAGGTVGSPDRQTYTVYGDAVNLSQRLEALNKELGTRCLIGATTVEAAGDRAGNLRSLGTVPIRNRTKPTAVYTHADRPAERPGI
ncbi:adenylate/guanylate cyclase domain-containing protein [Rhizobium sp. CF142]|uniref:adenylate/guanylate cyclase domain-containing protein n=1 Tax=Rhizobium sp. CF142 TaxID=1144314 RepID=UPI00026EF4D9|nr:adenylate/guanylate cyclase domain-containing protein [Rhizobium sp. CF142]EJJ27079.1 family 3 adenylate cyclase [Rhizobium sp. CF142]